MSSPIKVKKWKTNAKKQSTLASVGFLFPIILVFLVLFAYPLVKTFYFSFTNYRILNSDFKFVGFKNYHTVFTNSTLLTGLGFTLMFTVFVTVFTTVLAIPLAVFLNQKFMGQKIARSMLFFLGIPSQAILGLIWQYIFSPLKSGALNKVIRTFGGEAIPWLADPTIARWCVIFVAVWAGVGWHATLYLAYLQSIPADLYEQSLVDGANSVQQFFHITLPQLTPAITISSFLLVTGGLKIFDLPYAMTLGGPGVATNTVTQQIILQGLANGNMGLGSALAVLFTLTCIVIVLLQVWAVNAVTRRFT